MHGKGTGYTGCLTVSTILLLYLQRYESTIIVVTNIYQTVDRKRVYIVHHACSFWIPKSKNNFYFCRAHFHATKPSDKTNYNYEHFKF